jgi:hypothetical protein
MTWTSPKTWTSGDLVPAADLNSYIRDNMLEMSPSKASTVGSLFVTADTNSISERRPAGDFVSTLQSTTTTATYLDLATVGPSVTVECTSYAIIYIYAHMFHSAGTGVWMSFEVSGATTIAANDNTAILLQNTGGQRVGSAFLYSSLNAGMNTFTAKYRISGAGTGNWSDRRIAVLPF